MLKTWSLCGLHPLGNSSHLSKDFAQWGLLTKTHAYSLVNIFIKRTHKFIIHKFVTQKAYPMLNKKVKT
jgi:hypothetical protein